MANFFEGIPERENAKVGETVDAGWWNIIRLYLINFANTFLGAGAVAESQEDILDGQSEYQDISGLVFNSEEVVSFDAEYTILRTDGSTTRRERGSLYVHFVDGAWTYSRELKHGQVALGDAIDNSLHVESVDTGEGIEAHVQYKSDEMGGDYEGTIRFKVTSTFSKEVSA